MTDTNPTPTKQGETLQRWNREPDPCWSCGGEAEARDDIHVRCTDSKGINCEVMNHWFTRKTWNTRRAADASLWREAASIVEACLNVHSTYSDTEREFASHLIEVFKTRDQHPGYRHRNTVHAYPAATASPTPAEISDAGLERLLTSLKRPCGCTDHDPEVCLEGEVDEGQRYCHCECHVPAPPPESTRVEGEGHEHRYVGRGEYGDTSVGYMCADCGIDLDDIPDNETLPTSDSARRAAEGEFLAASVAVWREIDLLSESPEGYKGLDASTELRKRERAAWENYRTFAATPADTEAKEPGTAA